MKTIIRTFCFLLLIGSINIGCIGSKTALVKKQTYYKFSSENFGYSDIKKMYSSDSVNANKAFFKSETLQYIEMKIETEIKKTVLKQTSNGELICYQLQNPMVDIKKGETSITSNKITKDLMKPVFVQTNTSGKIEHLKFDSEITEMAKGLYKEMISRMQFVKPISKTRKWQSIEENTAGSFIAEYDTNKRDRKHNVYDKKILKYLTYKSKKENQNIKIDNNTTIETDKAGSVKTINTSEAQIVLHDKDTLSVLGSRVSAFKSSEKRIKKDEIEGLLNLENSMKYAQKTTLSEALSKEKIKHMSYAGTLGSKDWESLVENLSKTENLTKDAKGDLILKFRALFYLHPEYCNLAVSVLEKELNTSNIFKVLTKALAITETPSSTDAIAMIIKHNKNSEDVVGTLIPVLTTTKYPTDSAINILKTIAFGNEASQDYFTKSTAQLALGGMANRLRQSDSLKSNALTRFLIKEMKLEKDTIQSLLVFGNTGSPLVFSQINAMLDTKTTSIEIKIEAISALALIEGRDISNYLRNLIYSNNEDIKNKAIEVRDFRKNYFKQLD